LNTRTLGRALTAGAVLSVVAILASWLGPVGHIAQAAPNRAINTKALLHDSWNIAYRTPFGAAPKGSHVTLRLRTAHSGASSVTLYVNFMRAEDFDQARSSSAGHLALKRVTSSNKKFDTWQTAFTPQKVGIYLYRFQVKVGAASVWYSNNEAQYGGIGLAYKKKPDQWFRLTSYDPAFVAPSWASNAVIYQIFPDRFFNGDRANDQSGMQAPYAGTESFCALQVHTNESDTPNNNCDFFGGDLQGVIDKLPYLSGLGVNTLYLNPIFLSPSNHKYDTADYYTIDPRFGTQETFNKLVGAAHAAHMHLILDGVFNHTSTDSVYFNKFGHFPSVGASQSHNSPYYSFYHFTSWPSTYDTFFDVRTLPQLSENDAVKDFIYRLQDAVAPHWLGLGADGWRLDAAHLKSHAWWQDFRSATKARYPDDMLICECDLAPRDAVPWLLGNEVDGTMNYRWRQSVLQFFTSPPSLSSGRSVTTFYKQLNSMLEEYPRPAIYSSMNLVDSHDTDRITSVVGESRSLQKQIATFQMTWLGAPTIYYGDEAGLTGADTDPQRRRFFPWNTPDTALQDFYKRVIGVRNANPALRDGSISPVLLDNRNRVFGFMRTDARQHVVVAVNGNPATHGVTLALPAIPNGTRLTDALGGATTTVADHKVTITLPGQSTAILVQSPGS
jgi:cyclomaltodextrinase